MITRAHGIRLRPISRTPTAGPGLALAFLVAQDFLGDDDLVMYPGDGFIGAGIPRVVDGFRRARAVPPSLRGELDISIDDASEITGRIRVASGGRVLARRVVSLAVIGVGTVIADSCPGRFLNECGVLTPAPRTPDVRRPVPGDRSKLPSPS